MPPQTAAARFTTSALSTVLKTESHHTAANRASRLAWVRYFYNLYETRRQALGSTSGPTAYNNEALFYNAVAQWVRPAHGAPYNDIALFSAPHLAHYVQTGNLSSVDQILFSNFPLVVAIYTLTHAYPDLSFEWGFVDGPPGANGAPIPLFRVIASPKGANANAPLDRVVVSPGYGERFAMQWDVAASILAEGKSRVLLYSPPGVFPSHLDVAQIGGRENAIPNHVSSPDAYADALHVMLHHFDQRHPHGGSILVVAHSNGVPAVVRHILRHPNDHGVGALVAVSPHFAPGPRQTYPALLLPLIADPDTGPLVSVGRRVTPEETRAFPDLFSGPTALALSEPRKTGLTGYYLVGPDPEAFKTLVDELHATGRILTNIPTFAVHASDDPSSDPQTGMARMEAFFGPIDGTRHRAWNPAVGGHYPFAHIETAKDFRARTLVFLEATREERLANDTDIPEPDFRPAPLAEVAPPLTIPQQALRAVGGETLGMNWALRELSAIEQARWEDLWRRNSPTSSSRFPTLDAYRQWVFQEAIARNRANRPLLETALLLCAETFFNEGRQGPALLQVSDAIVPGTPVGRNALPVYLYTLTVQPAGTPTGIYLIIPDAGRSLIDYLPLARGLAREGFAVTLYDPRGQGLSSSQEHASALPLRFLDRNFPVAGELDSASSRMGDLWRVSAYVHGEFADLPLTVYGHGAGARTAMNLETLFPKNPAGISHTVLVAPFNGVDLTREESGFQEWLHRPHSESIVLQSVHRLTSTWTQATRLDRSPIAADAQDRGPWAVPIRGGSSREATAEAEALVGEIVRRQRHGRLGTNEISALVILGNPSEHALFNRPLESLEGHPTVAQTLGAKLVEGKSPQIPTGDGDVQNEVTLLTGSAPTSSVPLGQEPWVARPIHNRPLWDVGHGAPSFFGYFSNTAWDNRRVMAGEAPTVADAGLRYLVEQNAPKNLLSQWLRRTSLTLRTWALPKVKALLDTGFAQGLLTYLSLDAEALTPLLGEPAPRYHPGLPLSESASRTQVGENPPFPPTFEQLQADYAAAYRDTLDYLEMRGRDLVALAEEGLIEEEGLTEEENWTAKWNQLSAETIAAGEMSAIAADPAADPRNFAEKVAEGRKLVQGLFRDLYNAEVQDPLPAFQEIADAEDAYRRSVFENAGIQRILRPEQEPLTTSIARLDQSSEIQDMMLRFQIASVYHRWQREETAVEMQTVYPAQAAASRFEFLQLIKNYINPQLSEEGRAEGASAETRARCAQLQTALQDWVIAMQMRSTADPLTALDELDLRPYLHLSTEQLNELNPRRLVSTKDYNQIQAAEDALQSTLEADRKATRAHFLVYGERIAHLANAMETQNLNEIPLEMEFAEAYYRGLFDRLEILYALEGIEESGSPYAPPQFSRRRTSLEALANGDLLRLERLEGLEDLLTAYQSSLQDLQAYYAHLLSYQDLKNSGFKYKVFTLASLRKVACQALLDLHVAVRELYDSLSPDQAAQIRAYSALFPNYALPLDNPREDFDNYMDRMAWSPLGRAAEVYRSVDGVVDSNRITELAESWGFDSLTRMLAEVRFTFERGTLEYFNYRPSPEILEALVKDGLEAIGYDNETLTFYFPHGALVLHVHTGQIEFPRLGAWRQKVLAQLTVQEVPVFGAAIGAGQMGTFIDRANAAESQLQVASMIAGGKVVLIFPEGTREPSGFGNLLVDYDKDPLVAVSAPQHMLSDPSRAAFDNKLIVGGKGFVIPAAHTEGGWSVGTEGRPDTQTNGFPMSSGAKNAEAAVAEGIDAYRRMGTQRGVGRHGRPLAAEAFLSTRDGVKNFSTYTTEQGEQIIKDSADAALALRAVDFFERRFWQVRNLTWMTQHIKDPAQQTAFRNAISNPTRFEEWFCEAMKLVTRGRENRLQPWEQALLAHCERHLAHSNREELVAIFKALSDARFLANLMNHALVTHAQLQLSCLSSDLIPANSTPTPIATAPRGQAAPNTSPLAAAAAPSSEQASSFRAALASVSSEEAERIAVLAEALPSNDSLFRPLDESERLIRAHQFLDGLRDSDTPEMNPILSVLDEEFSSHDEKVQRIASLLQQRQNWTARTPAYSGVLAPVGAAAGGARAALPAGAGVR